MIKINKPEVIIHNGRAVYCVLAELMLIDVSKETKATKLNDLIIKQDGVFLPVFISKTENWIIGETVVAKPYSRTEGERYSIQTVKATGYEWFYGERGIIDSISYDTDTAYKVIALPQDISLEYRQDIISDKLKGGDKVWIEIETTNRDYRSETGVIFTVKQPLTVYPLVGINQKDLPSNEKRRYSREELFEALSKYRSFAWKHGTSLKDFHSWFNKNYPE